MAVLFIVTCSVLAIRFIFKDKEPKTNHYIGPELVRTIDISGTITHSNEGISDVQILPTGELVFSNNGIFYIDNGNIEIPRKSTISLVKEIGGKLAYVTNNESGTGENLIFDGKVLVSNVFIVNFIDIAGKLAYIYSNNNGSISRLVYDGNEIASTSGDFFVKNVAEKLVYVINEETKDAFKSILYYNGKLIDSRTGKVLTTNVGGTVINTWKDPYIESIFEVDGILGYIIAGEKSDSLYYNNKEILTAERIGISQDETSERRNSPKSEFYFYGANEDNGTTTFSIYRLGQS